MYISEFIKKAFQQFSIILASVIITLTILGQLFNPDLIFDLKSIYIIMVFSLVSALVSFVLYAPDNISEKSMRIRRVIHFLVIETLLISLGYAFGIVDSTSSIITLAVEIAIIHGFVRLVSWRNDKKVSNAINEKLKSLKNEVEQSSIE
ncbi:DUF3021 family protein [Paenibacillus sp. NPDC058071]|uniref:DUF3021 family protein n=1 Tax=Paenibacillus sp. NPDC058071 TaxID=3346326 RepID=UPI0036DB1E1A